MKIPDDLKTELLQLFFWSVFIATIIFYSDNVWLWIVKKFAYAGEVG